MKRPLLIFTVLAFGLSWAVALPLWFGGGLGSPLMPVLGTLMMFTPAAGCSACGPSRARRSASGPGRPGSRSAIAEAAPPCWC